MCGAIDKNATVVAVCLSGGGIPKLPQDEVRVVESGIVGDGHDHAKHNKPKRALSLLDEELLLELKGEGYDLVPGGTGENVLLRGVRVQQMAPGTTLRLGDTVIQLEEPRKPCFVLDAIDPRLKDSIVGRCGYMASVVKGGRIRPGDSVSLAEEQDSADDSETAAAEHDSADTGVVLGVLARVDVSRREQVVQAIEQLDGVSTFSVEEEQRVGVLIESPNVDEAHAVLTGQLNHVPGVLGTWPVYGDFSSDGSVAVMDQSNSEVAAIPLKEGVGDVDNTP